MPQLKEETQEEPQEDPSEQKNGMRTDMFAPGIDQSGVYPYRNMVVGAVAVVLVSICCMVSQCLMSWSKRAKQNLNKYYQKKKFEKAKLIQQYLTQQEQAQLEGQGDAFIERSQSPSGPMLDQRRY